MWIALILVVKSPQGFAAQIDNPCPAVNKINNIFDSSRVIPESRIAIENDDVDNEKLLIFYTQSGGGCQKFIFAKYPVEGGMPIVESVFFYRLRNQQNVFAIVSWSINSRGDGIFGKLYQVYAYKLSDKGVLVENKWIVGDTNMTGIDGYDRGRSIKFRYKNSIEIKKYLKRKGGDRMFDQNF